MNSIRSTMRALLPPALRKLLRDTVSGLQVLGLSLADARSYLKYSATVGDPCSNEELLEARIAATYHVLEKGLSFRDTRPGFGGQVAENLIALLKAYNGQFCGKPCAAFEEGLSALARYIEFNEAHGVPVETLRKDLAALRENVTPGGTLKMSRDEYFKGAASDFAAFCRSRRSVRHFTDEPVDMAAVARAVEMAQTAPSVCNRQAVRVYAVTPADKVRRLMELQRGTRGFTEQINRAIVLTYSIRAFSGISERYQGYTDGGIFAMNLLYALHYMRIGSCPLIWASGRHAEREIRQMLNIPVHEHIFMIMALGNVPEKFEVAEAKRFPLERIFRMVD
ncbi:MAG: nitroreductase family protein [Kiritimatiellia bacterium]